MILGERGLSSRLEAGRLFTASSYVGERWQDGDKEKDGDRDQYRGWGRGLPGGSVVKIHLPMQEMQEMWV